MAVEKTQKDVDNSITFGNVGEIKQSAFGDGQVGEMKETSNAKWWALLGVVIVITLGIVYALSQGYISTIAIKDFVINATATGNQLPSD